MVKKVQDTDSDQSMTSAPQEGKSFDLYTSSVEGLITYGILFLRGDISILLLPLSGFCVLVTVLLFWAARRAPQTFRFRS